MANDYTIKMGWDASQALTGINTLERKLAKITSNPANPAGRTKAAFDSETKKLQLTKRTNREIERTIQLLNSIPKGKAFDAQRESLQKQIGSLHKLKGAVESTTLKSKKHFNEYATNLERLTHKTRTLGIATKKASSSVTLLGRVGGGIKKSFMSGTIAMLGFYSAINAVKAGIQNAREFENLEVQMLAATGSTQGADNALKFVKDTALELGAPIMALSKGYAQLSTAARMSGLSVQEGKDIFLAAAESAKVFGLSQEQTDGVIRAFTQMIGKQQVMAEELKLQLGDRFPPAMGLFAKSMGVSVKELTKLMEQGLVTTEHLKKFGETLRQDVRDSGALAASLETLDTAMNRFSVRAALAGDAFMGGAMNEAIKSFVNIGSELLQDITPFLEFLGDIFGALLWGASKLLYLLKLVTVPLKGIGMIWQSIKDVSLIDEKDMEKLNWVAYTFRLITGFVYDVYYGWVEIWALLKGLAEWWQSLDIWDEIFEFMFGEKQKVADSVAARQNAAAAGGKMNSDNTVIVNVDQTTTPEVVKDLLTGTLGVPAEMYVVEKT